MQNALLELTLEELNDIIEKTVEKKIAEILNDDDCGLKLKEQVKIRLNNQFQDTLKGYSGRNFNDVLSELNV